MVHLPPTIATDHGGSCPWWRSIAAFGCILVACVLAISRYVQVEPNWGGLSQHDKSHDYHRQHSTHPNVVRPPPPPAAQWLATTIATTRNHPQPHAVAAPFLDIEAPALSRLVNQGRALAPAPLILSVVSYEYVSTVFNFAAVLRRLVLCPVDIPTLTPTTIHDVDRH